MAGKRIIALVLVAASLATAASVAPCIASQTQPSATNAATNRTSPAREEVVWVNTASGYYHKPNSRHYGKTKHGKYMQEADALKAGYRAARN